jgi:hypothetical protein
MKGQGGARMSISLGLDVGAVSVKLAALGAPEDYPVLAHLAEVFSAFFLPKLPKGNGLSRRPVVLSTYPIHNFYFDGQQSDLDRDIGIYLELARSYRERKPYKRFYPSWYSRRENVEIPASFLCRSSDSHPDWVSV